MKLAEMRKGEHGLIRHIDADADLRNRLHSFGIVPGESLTVKECSLARKTIKIDVDGTLVALRRDEAKKIEVEKSKADAA